MKSKAKLVKLEPEENRGLEEAAKRLGISASEILRRSWRIAEPKLGKIPAPGVRIEGDGR